MKADYTNKSPEISELLMRLGNNATAIPYYAYFHSGSRDPIHFNGFFVAPDGLLKMLEENNDSAAKLDSKTNVAGAAERKPLDP